MELTQDQMVRINKGACLLDEKRADWYNSNFDVLDVDSFLTCVLCKVYGDFWFGIGELFDIKSLDLNLLPEITEYGFYPHADDPVEDIEVSDELAKAKTEYWLKQIQQRRENVS